MRRAIAILFVLLLSGACRTSFFYPGRPRPPRYRIVAYVFGGRADISRINAHKLTHINYAFGLVNEACEVEFRDPDAPAHLARLQALKSKNAGLKIILSIGGWGADNFSDAALTETTRMQFAASAIDLVKRYALDGIDLDWEYPGQPAAGIKHRPEDKENFTLLLKTLRQSLNALSDERRRAGMDRYTLTIASSGDEAYFQNTEMDKLHAHLDWINIMTYDFTGNWSNTTGHHAPLYRSHTVNLSSEDYVRRHLREGIPSRKLVLGVPFYGKGWTEVRAENRGLHQPSGCYLRGYSFSILAREYIDRLGFKRYWDRSARVPYLWNATAATFITYDDPESLRHKARFVKRHRLGGMMYWEHSHDPDEILLDTLFRSLR